MTDYLSTFQAFAKNTTYAVSNKFVESTASVKKNSDLFETGQINGQEFVLAGDNLINATGEQWHWCDAETPADRSVHIDEKKEEKKQYLVSNRVPCYKRVRDLHEQGNEKYRACSREQARGLEGDESLEDTEWFRTDDLDEPQNGPNDRKSSTLKADEEREDEEEHQDEEEIGDMDEDQDDPQAIIKNQTAIIPRNKKYREYVIYIVYSGHYHCPRAFLSGYSHDGTPLTSNEIMQDVMVDHVFTTTSFLNFPYFSNPTRMLSIHPCNHASAMLSFLKKIKAAMDKQVLMLREAREKGSEGATTHTASTFKDSDIDKLLAMYLKPEVNKGNGKEATDSNADEWQMVTSDDESRSEKKDDPEREKKRQEAVLYFNVFFKFLTSIIPTIDFDYTREVHLA